MNENLYMRKLFTELEFLTLDHEFKNQMFDKYQIEFNQKIVEFLENNPLIKEEYDNIVNGMMPVPVDNAQEREHHQQREQERTPEEKEEFERKKKEIEDSLKDEEFAENLEKRTFTEDPDIKRLYREIVKKTHPDKIKNLSSSQQEVHKKYYLKATDAYNSQNLYEIVRLATILDIELGDLSDENLDRLEADLKKLRVEIKQIESTIPWKYFEVLRNDIERGILIKQFVLMFINNHKGVNDFPIKPM